MLNTANQFTTDSTGAPPGWRAFDILVSSRNLMNNPVRAFAVTDPCNTTIEVRSPDPGIMITDVYNIPDAGAVPAAEGALHPAPGVLCQHVQDPAAAWRQAHGALLPRQLCEGPRGVLEQYVFMFTSNQGFPITDSNILLTQQDIRDIIAFLKLL